MNQKLLNKTLEIFTMFLIRKTEWTALQIIREVSVVRREAEKAGGIENLDYVRMSRLGALKVLDRGGRTQMQMILGNAINHAHFALDGDK